VFDKVSWSDTPIFHNTLVVGSRPTSSTTQSHVLEIIAILCGRGRVQVGAPYQEDQVDDLGQVRKVWFLILTSCVISHGVFR